MDVMRVLSGIQPSGDLHIGNYLGAIRNWVKEQYENDAFYTIVDLHAITVEHSPKALRDNSLSLAATLIAAGLNPEICTIFVQSHVSAHSELAWLLECTATYGELSRMTQFKDKGKNSESIRAGLFTYPALMAADILVYRADMVPVGEDQRQHLELARDIAVRFNSKYGETFTIPTAKIPPFGARIMDLSNPNKKMSKSSESKAGTLFILDSHDDIAKKISRAVTDTDNQVRYDPQNKPGVSNLIELLAAAIGQLPADVAEKFSLYGELKKATTDAVISMLDPVQKRYIELIEDPKAIRDILKMGADKARAASSATLRSAKENIGLLQP